MLPACGLAASHGESQTRKREKFRWNLLAAGTAVPL